MLPRRLCVKCQVETAERPMGKVVADSCPQCGGLFFPNGALDVCLGQPGLASKIAGRESCCPVCYLPMASGAPRCAGCGAATPRLDCPATAAHGALKRVLVGGIVVEVCAMCEGLFLDRGELSKVLAAAQAPACKSCGAELPDPKAGYLTDRGRICSACFRMEARQARAAQATFDDRVDSFIDHLFEMEPRLFRRWPF